MTYHEKYGEGEKACDVYIFLTGFPERLPAFEVDLVRSGKEAVAECLREGAGLFVYGDPLNGAKG